MKTDILGVTFDAINMDETVARGLDVLSKPRVGAAKYVVTPNPEIVQKCMRDGGIMRAVNGACLVLPDGIGIVYAAKILGKPLKSRIAGIDFASKMLEKCAELGYSVYFLGAKPGVAETAAEKLRERYAGLRVAGCADGYFTDDAPVIERINAAEPDFLIVGLGAPKQQEMWLAQNAGSINAKLCGGFGGSLDVFAGNVKRAPVMWQKLGFEWLYRLIKEPRRIKRMIKLPLFLVSAFAARLNGRN